jgi:predicted nucleic acid-binding protein
MTVRAFADTFYFLAILNARDAMHEKEQYGVTDALTGDRHFEQAGFRALLA